MVVSKESLLRGWSRTRRAVKLFEKNFFLVPNAIYQMDLSAGAKRIYTYLCYCENRKTYQCYPSYKTISKNVGMSINTVHKYVAELVEKRLIATENTCRFTSEGMKQNSVLCYTLLPIQNAVDCYHERQMTAFRHAVDLQNVTVKAEKLGVDFIPATE